MVFNSNAIGALEEFAYQLRNIEKTAFNFETFLAQKIEKGCGEITSHENRVHNKVPSFEETEIFV